MTTTLAIERYDRHIPFFDGTVEVPKGLDLKVLQVGQENTLRDGAHRHDRMLRSAEFDAAEVSLSSYIAAKARGAAFTAIPVFPRRLFSLGQVFVHRDSPYKHPRELAGKKVGLQTYQTTLAVLAKGDMASEYGLPLREVQWITRKAETIDVRLPDGIKVTRLEKGQSIVRELAEGRIDALFYSRSPWTDPDPSLPIRRLFDDPQGEEARFYKKNGYWPIMHILAIRNSSVEKNPALPLQLMDVFGSAQKIANEYLDDPGWCRLAWTKYMREGEARGLSTKLWPQTVSGNRANLERFIGYSHDQGIIPQKISVDEMFHPSVRGT